MQAFLTVLAVDRQVASSTQNQAKAALRFLYGEALLIELPWLDEMVGRTTAEDFRWCSLRRRCDGCFRSVGRARSRRFAALRCRHAFA